MGREIAADVLDSKRNDWTISDDGTNRGPIRTWPAPRLPNNDSNPALGPKATLTRSGLPDAYAFLRPTLGGVKLTIDDFPDEEGPNVPTSDAMGLPSYRTVPKPLSSFAYDVPGVDRYEASMLMNFMKRTDAGALDSFHEPYFIAKSELGAHGFDDSTGFFDFVKKAASSVGKAVGGAVTGVGKGVVSVAKGVASPVAKLVTSPIKLVGDIASGKNVFQSLKDTVKRDLASVKEVAPYVQAAISVIPGVGQGVNAAIAAGAALAQGQPITSALVSGLKGALPGGPIAAQAFDTAYNIARGQNVGEAALQALVNNAPGGQIGKQAAQAAIAIAKGQNLQQAALTAVKGVAAEKLGAIIPASTPNLIKTAVSDLAQGKSLTETAKDAVGSAAMQSTLSKLSPLVTGVMNNAGPRLPALLKSTLPSILPNDVKMVASSLLATPSLRNLPVEELSRRLNVSTHAVRDGMGAVLQAVQKSGGPTVPSLSYARSLASRIPMNMSLDRAMPAFASKVGPKVYSHNVASPAAAAARLRRAGSIFHALSARGLDCGALDPKTMPTIKQGSSGEAVVQWQKILGVKADGIFGPQTTLATKNFQSKNGLVADGIVGLKSWTAGLLQVVTTTPATVPGTNIPISVPPPATTGPIIAGTMPLIQRGSTGPAVKTWQTYLSIPADGIFGPQTEDATKAFQAKNGLVVDGKVGPKTWEKAMSGTSAPPTNLPPPISTPPINIPPMTIPIPGLPPITTPPVSIPPVIVGQPPPPIPPSLPPGMPPVVTTPPAPPNPPGQPPPPPPITTSPPGTPPVVLPPPMPPTGGGGVSKNTLLIGGAVVLGALLLMGEGSRSKIV